MTKQNTAFHGPQRWLAFWCVGVAVALAGCASGPTAVPHDPLEPLNRGIYGFNEKIDTVVLKPVATVYRDIAPDTVRTGVHNFFGNLKDLWSSINALAQLRPQEAVENFMRFNVNTVFGLGGVIDLASEMGIPRTELDFGQTLGRWGMPAGPYIVLPLLGPSSGRDLLGTTIENRGDFVQGIECPIATRCRPCVRSKSEPTCCVPPACWAMSHSMPTASPAMCICSGDKARSRT